MRKTLALLVMIVLSLLGFACKSETESNATDTSAVATEASPIPPSSDTAAPNHTMAMDTTGTTATDTTGSTSTSAMPTTTVATGQPPAPSIEKKNYSVVTVYYATDRKSVVTANVENSYGSEPAPELQYGTADVSIPRDHQMGHIESPSWLHFEFRPNPERHVLILSLAHISNGAEFLQRIRSRVADPLHNEILVFVHGFNVDFGSAIKRTAQIAYDLGFEGVPVTYTWPSQATLSLAAYRRDADASAETVGHLSQFLTDLAQRTGAAKIHVIAHSMGNKALEQALAGIAGNQAIAPKPHFNEVMLTAPDVDEDVMRDLAKQFAPPLVQRVTMYASHKDLALVAAHKFTKARRAGEGGDGMLVLPGIDSVEASAVDTNLIGHFYYGENRSVLSDMFYLIRENQPPAHRFGMKEHKRSMDSYWEFAP